MGLRIWLSILLLLTFSSCVDTTHGERRLKVLNKAERFFGEISIPSSETQSLWQMTDFRVFGRSEVLYVAAGSPYIAQYVESPELFQVVIPLWCEGKGLDGEIRKLRREFHIIIETFGTNDDSTWRIQSHEFQNDQPLTLLRQLLTCILWCFLGPILIFMCLSANVRLFWALVIMELISLPLVGYISYICFGTVSAVCISIGISLVIRIMLWRIAIVRMKNH